jgi:hypothetical protein
MAAGASAVPWIAGFTLVGCLAPPIGLGSGATTQPGSTGVMVGGTASIGAAPHRQSFQLEAHGALTLRRWFNLEAGAVYSQVSDDRAGGVLVAGGLPYLRPRLVIGPVSIATAVGGFGFGGGGGGFIGGIADAQLGYGTPSWSIYLGAYAHGFELTSEAPIEISARQQRLGGEYLWSLGAARLGVALELHHQRDDIRDDNVRVRSDQWGGALKLRIQSGKFQ